MGLREDLASGRHAALGKWLGLALVLAFLLLKGLWPPAPGIGLILAGALSVLTGGLFISGAIPRVIWAGRERAGGVFLVLLGVFHLYVTASPAGAHAP